MKKLWEDVKSCITIVMTLGLVALLFMPNLEPPKEILALYCTSYGSILAYYFNKRDEGKENESNDIKISKE